MKEPDSEQTYLEFNDSTDNSSADNLPTSEEEEVEVEVEFSEEDFAKLARKANGHTDDIDNSDDSIPSQTMEEDSSESEAAETDEESHVLHNNQKKISGPYLKILVAVILTSTLAISLYFLNSSWVKIKNISQGKTDSSEKDNSTSPLEKQKFEIDRLKAELALIEQDKKPIPPPKSSEPEPEPKPETKPEPRPEPKPEPKPASQETESEEIDPYRQWELLANSGTMGSSDRSSDIKRTYDTVRVDVNENQNQDRTRTSKIPNQIASRVLQNSYFEQQSEQSDGPSSASLSISRQRTPNPKETTLDSNEIFSADARQIILDGLGVEGNRTAKPEILITTVKGTLIDPIVWTDDSLSQDTRARILLEESINFGNGDLAIPQGATIVVEVTDWNDAGFVTLNAVVLSYEDESDRLNQVELEPDSFSVRDKDNQPLAFKTEKNDDDKAIGFLGALVRESSRSLPVPRGLGNSVSRALNGSGLRRSRSDNIYFVEADTAVSIFINKPLILNKSKLPTPN